VSVSPSVGPFRPVDRHRPLAAAGARAAGIDREMPAPRNGYRSIAAGIRAAAAGSVMLRAEVRGSTQDLFHLLVCWFHAVDYAGFCQLFSTHHKLRMRIL